MGGDCRVPVEPSLVRLVPLSKRLRELACPFHGRLRTRKWAVTRHQSGECLDFGLQLPEL